MKILYALVTVCIFSAAEAGSVQCRLCNRAANLDDCTRLVTCDDTLEACYMDELVTDQVTVVYEGGCRAKDVCSKQGRKKKNDLVSCSQCCETDDCNKRLCGIPNPSLNSTECYSCDNRSPSSQNSVSSPDECVTLTTCQANEVCYTQAGFSGTFYYGCQRKSVCGLLMEQTFRDIDRCLTGGSPSLCGGTKRSFNLCNSCCAGNGCNYGTCTEQNDRLYRLWKYGLFDTHTLTVRTG